MGTNKRHDPSQAMLVTGNVFPTNMPVVTNGCDYSMNVYPANAMTGTTKKPFLFTVIVVAIIAFIGLLFLIYDCLRQRQRRTLITAATKSHQLVTSLFPANVRDRLLEKEKEKKKPKKTKKPNSRKSIASKGPMSVDGTNATVLSQETSESTNNSNAVADIFKSKPIADLFPHCTVLFADMVGFTAWSSIREPTQVFHLLETVYHAFDKIARKHGVFKVG